MKVKSSMNPIMKTIAALCVFLLGMGMADQAEGAQEVYVVKVEGLVDSGLHAYIERSLRAAENDGAEGIILHMDTFGGLVDAADKIRNTLLDAEITTATYIDKNAASAGALIAIATDSIYMASGSAIGAATVVGGDGQKADEKMQSYFRSIMRSTAESKNRDPRVAEAMVDERIEIDNIIAEGELLTLSTSEAIDIGFVNGSANNLDEVKEKMGWADRNFVHMEERWQESILRFLANPVLTGLFMMMMLGGLYFELQSPGVGFPGAVAMVGALMFFAPHFILGLASVWELMFILAGVALIMIEIFVLPGFGVPGILGALLLIFGLFSSLVGNVGFSFPELDQMSSPIWTMATTLIIGILLIISMARYLPQNRAFSKLILATSTDQQSGYSSFKEREDLTGKEGIALTALRPSGTVLIDDRRFDVVTEGDFIEKGAKIKVVSSSTSTITVRKLEKSPAWSR